MQKAMEQMNIKLTNVISDLTGASGQRIVTVILDGERDALALSELADIRCKRSREEIAFSLEGTWDADHLFELRQPYKLYQTYQKMVEECDREIEKLLRGFV